MERLWMFTVMTGQIADMTWPDSSETSVYGDISISPDSCAGHGGSDVFPFGILEADVDGFEVREDGRILALNSRQPGSMPLALYSCHHRNAASGGICGLPFSLRISPILARLNRPFSTRSTDFASSPFPIDPRILPFSPERSRLRPASRGT